MKHKNNQALFDYWNSVRGDRVAPRRFDIEPGRLGPVLPDTFILERKDDGALIYRLAGTRLCDSFGADLRGRNFLDGLNSGDLVKLKPHLDCVINQGAVSVLTLEIENTNHTAGTVEVRRRTQATREPSAERAGSAIQTRRSKSSSRMAFPVGSKV